ncbi:hypothetical protein QQS21_009571 [Conoideocrella luteorostrata]|uniref:N-acetyltransferase domain-containing protein n=1 Tax=Conoideocrella luteorostrata TaxID=1105319 RepID=A0AAJ0CJ07_9HYPO|nr:hypothetical protein QQS21_009571 [Conoideocrella luteorostrata]
MIEPSDLQLITVKTTLPSTPHQRAPEIRTSRLILRKFKPSDLQSLFKLQSQPQVAAWSPSGQPQTDIEKTKTNLQRRIEGENDRNCAYAICLLSGEFIGSGGVYSRQGLLGWPDLGYSLLYEHWGKGYATEFLQAFLQAWWDMPRVDCEVRVDAGTVGCVEGSVVDERIVGFTVEENKGSRGVLTKCGLELVKLWRTPDMRDETKMVDLYCYATASRSARLQ